LPFELSLPMIAPVSEKFKPIKSGLTELLARDSDQQIVSIAQFLEQAAKLVPGHAENLERGKA
jgi:hypothetical protein